jgi:hypothetical protein
MAASARTIERADASRLALSTEISCVKAPSWSMIPGIKPEGMLFGKPVSTPGSSPAQAFSGSCSKKRHALYRNGRGRQSPTVSRRCRASPEAFWEKHSRVAAPQARQHLN